jgi:hypothetical protein
VNCHARGIDDAESNESNTEHLFVVQQLSEDGPGNPAERSFIEPTGSLFLSCASRSLLSTSVSPCVFAFVARSRRRHMISFSCLVLACFLSDHSMASSVFFGSFIT